VHPAVCPGLRGHPAGDVRSLPAHGCRAQWHRSVARVVPAPAGAWRGHAAPGHARGTGVRPAIVRPSVDRNAHGRVAGRRTLERIPRRGPRTRARSLAGGSIMRRMGFAALALILVGCAPTAPRNTGVYLLVDTSGSYDRQVSKTE